MSETNKLEINERTQSFSSSNSFITLPKQTYRILSPWYIYVLAVIFLFGGFAFLAIGIVELAQGKKLNIHNFIIFPILVIISCLITYFFPFYSSITVDMTNKLVIVKKYKLFFIIKKETKIDTNEIERAYTEINYTTDDDEKKDKSTEDGFNLVFEMKNGEKIIPLEGESDKNFEMMKIGFFIKKYFSGFDSSQNKSDDIGIDKLIGTDN